MTNLWQLAFSGACLVALGTLALGLWIGVRIGQDRAADAETAAPAPGRHRVAVPRQLPAAPKQASGSTAELFARLEAEVGRPTITMQPPIGALVAPAREHRPGRATDFITALERDTDRFIAAMGGDR